MPTMQSQDQNYKLIYKWNFQGQIKRKKEKEVELMEEEREEICETRGLFIMTRAKQASQS